MATMRERVSKDGKKSYHVQVRKRGHPPVTATFASKTKAKEWVQKTETAINEGRYFKTAEERKHTLAEAVERYEREVYPKFSPYEQKQRRIC